MNAFGHAAARMALAIAVTLGLSALLGDQARAFEAQAIASMLHAIFGVDVEAVFGGAILIEQTNAAPVVARVTLSCSAIVGVVTFLSVSVIFMRGRPLQQRTRAFLLASLVWATVNVIRISGAVLAAHGWGHHAFEIFHNWIGTGLAVLGAVAAFMVMISSYLPSSRVLEKGPANG